MYKNSHEKISKGFLQKVVRDFCESTSLHGYSNLYNADSICTKFLWMLVISSTTAGGIFLFIKNTNDYITARIVTDIETSSANLSVSRN